MRLSAPLAVVLLAGSCAAPLTDTGPLAPEPAALRRIDWPAAGDEAARLLSGYLQIDTSNPPGNETAGAEYLAAFLAREGIPAGLVETAPGRSALIARLGDGATGSPLCLLSHIDVAAANAEEWPKDKGPFSGVRDEAGMIWGRGALDMKGMGVLELMTLVWLKRLAVPLTRPVILIAAPDEEVGSTGMRALLGEPWAELGCSHLINEGGLGIRDLLFPGQTVFAISVAEKGVLWLRMTATGEAGHGSVPRPDTATARLLDALAKLRSREPALTLSPALFELLARAGDAGGGFEGFVLGRPSLVRAFAEGDLARNPMTHAILVDTVNVTHLDTPAGQPNVVPAKASAVLDCRTLPKTEPAAFVAELTRVVDDPNVSFEILSATRGNESPWDDPLYVALARELVRDRNDAVAGPALSPGYTDSILARDKGTRAYGIVPFELDREEVATMHGANERVSQQNLEKGLRILLNAVVDFATRRPSAR